MTTYTDTPAGPPERQVPPEGTADIPAGNPIEFVDESPQVMLSRQIAEARAKKAAEKRAIDSAALPIIQRDMEAADAHQKATQAQIDATQQKLNQPVPQYQPAQLGMGDIIAAGLASLAGGAQGGNQALAGAYQRADQLAGQRYKEAVDQHEQNRANTLQLLQSMNADQQTTAHVMQALEQQRIDSLQQQDQNAFTAQTDATNFDRQLEVLGKQQEFQAKQKELDRQAKMQTAGYQAQKSAALALLKHVMDTNADPAAKAEAIATIVRMDPSQDLINDPDIAKVLGAATYQQQNLEAKTKTEDALRDPRRRKIEADIDKMRSGMKVDQARVAEINRRTMLMPLEYQVRYFKAHKAIIDGVHKPSEQRAAFNSLRSVAEASAKQLEQEAADLIGAGGIIPAEAYQKLEAAKVARTEYERAGQALDELNKAITGTGGGSGAGSGGNSTLRNQAYAAIRNGADPAKVRARYKEKTGHDLN